MTWYIIMVLYNRFPHFYYWRIKKLPAIVAGTSGFNRDFASQNQWLENDAFPLWGKRPIFFGYVTFREFMEASKTCMMYVVKVQFI